MLDGNFAEQTKKGRGEEYAISVKDISDRFD